MTRAVVRWEHARLNKKIILYDTPGANGNGYGVCAWDTCDRDATSLHEVRTCEHVRGQWAAGWDGERMIEVAPRDVCAAVDAGIVAGRHITYAFCREGHRLYWLNSSGWNAHEAAARNNGQIYGQMPHGLRNRI